MRLKQSLDYTCSTKVQTLDQDMEVWFKRAQIQGLAPARANILIHYGVLAHVDRNPALRTRHGRDGVNIHRRLE